MDDGGLRRDVAAVIESLDLRDAVLIGHSMGGDAIVEAAVPARDVVKALVWVDVYPSLDEALTPDEVAAFVEPFRADFTTNVSAFVKTMFLPTVDPVLVDWVVEDMTSAPQEIALDALVHAFEQRSSR